MTTPAELATAGSRSQETELTDLMQGIPMLILGIVLLPAFGLGILVLIGLTLVNPNQSKVVLLFGKYQGTIRQHGFYWLNPFTVRKSVSLLRSFIRRKCSTARTTCSVVEATSLTISSRSSRTPVLSSPRRPWACSHNSCDLQSWSIQACNNCSTWCVTRYPAAVSLPSVAFS